MFIKKNDIYTKNGVPQQHGNREEYKTILKFPLSNLGRISTDMCIIYKTHKMLLFRGNLVWITYHLYPSKMIHFIYVYTLLL